MQYIFNIKAVFQYTLAFPPQDEHPTIMTNCSGATGTVQSSYSLT